MILALHLVLVDMFRLCCKYRGNFLSAVYIPAKRLIPSTGELNLEKDCLILFTLVPDTFKIMG